jgi:RNase P/RNase MRP subunit p29
VPDGRNPRPTCVETNSPPIDAGTSCLTASPTPTAVGSPTSLIAKQDLAPPELSPAAAIEAACVKAYRTSLACNFFVRNVRADLPEKFSALKLPDGKADAWVTAFNKEDSWKKTWMILRDEDEAMTYASKGAFVIVGLHSAVAAPNKTRSEINGVVKAITKDKISIMGDDGKLVDHVIPSGATVENAVKEGQRVKVKDALTSKQPADGHVAVIVAGTIDDGPKCYSTNMGKVKQYDGKSKGDKKLFGWVFKRDDKDHVQFFTPRDPAPDSKQ